MDPIIEIDDFSKETLDDVVHTELSNSEDEILREDVLTLTLSDEIPLQIQTGVASTSKDQIQIAQSYIPEQTVHLKETD